MVDGVENMRALFRRKAAAVLRAAKAQTTASGNEVAAAMRYLAPKDQRELVQSIRVEDAASIKTSKGERGFIGVVVKAGDATTIVTNQRGQKFQNAKLQEHGTKKMKANPYFNPAWRLNRRRVRSAITRAVRSAWVNG
jgi:HK97 gp10 family phage protein